MCGLKHTETENYNNSIEHLGEDINMPPSITLGTDHVKPTATVIQDDSVHVVHEGGASSNQEIPTIDLACDDAELQKAIVLSLQDQPVENPGLASILSAEERDVSKVIEDSMFDGSSQSTIEILNPIDKRRVNGVPVGLKNIGNSCWFNVVIQPLFYVPFFRDMIFKYPKSLEPNIDYGLSKDQNKRLVPTLRKLFSFLVASEKKYVDPTEAVNLFQGNEMQKNAQQDVCEFIHKLLEKLEEDFQFLLKKQGLEKETLENSMKESDFMKLFYGQARKEVEEDNGDPKLEIFGQYPLTVKKYKDIHESILASMTNETSLQDDINIEQETWFKTLPSILIFSLSRYEFSKEKQRAEKVHNKFDFPQYLFMDRYMEANKEIIKKKHLKIIEIKKELKSLYQSLENYQKYGSGECKYPLIDILKYALEFAESQQYTKSFDDASATTNSPVTMEIDVAEGGQDNDIEMKDSEEDQKCSIKLDSNAKTGPIEETSINTEEPVEMSPNKKMRLVPPAPQTLNPGELSILQTCLPRWQNEVEIQVNNLRCSINALERELDTIFEVPELIKIPYKLHAVVVHEGQASGGHYWVYIHDSFKDVWLKFNDIQVVTSNWQELLQESVGGQNNASAYCLMYIDETKDDMLFSGYKSNPDDIVKELPIDLQEYLKQDNIAFNKELQEWQNKQIQATATAMNDADAPRAVPVTAPNSPDIIRSEENDISILLTLQTMLSQQISSSLLNEKEFSKPTNKKDWLDYLDNIVKVDLNRLRDMAKSNQDNFGETMILDLGIYMLKNEEDEALLYYHGYGILYYITQIRNNFPKIVIEGAQSLFKQFKEKYAPTIENLYLGWKKNYLSLISCAWNLVCGHRKLQSRYYEAALMYVMQSLKLHKQLHESHPKGTSKTLDVKIILLCHRQCLVLFNEKLMEVVSNTGNERKAMEVVAKVNSIVLPALYFVTKNDAKVEEDIEAYIINNWIMLKEKSPPEKGPLITQIVEILTSETSEPNTNFVNISVKTPNVLSLYTEYKDVAAQLLNSESKPL